MNKILILLPYYNRPILVRNALRSIIQQDYEDWRLAFIDDSDDSSGRFIVESVFDKNALDKTIFYSTGDTLDKKIRQGGSRFPYFLNKAISEIEADIAIFLCDDDALYEDYLKKLNQYHTEHPEVVYCYSHVIPFDPQVETPSPSLGLREFPHNHTHTLMANCQVDASQVSWKIREVVKAGVRFNDIQTVNIDAHLYQQLDSLFGPCPFNGFISQYKGWFSGQLGKRCEHFCTNSKLMDK